MLSEGMLGVDNTYFLREGAFHLISGLEAANKLRDSNFASGQGKL